MYNYSNISDTSSIMRVDDRYYFSFSSYVNGENYSFKELLDLIKVVFDDEYYSYYLELLKEARDESCSLESFKYNLKKYNMMREFKSIF